ncbi:CmpA/NrtA family ABC transporter substrate-binding protein [Pseudoxanthomonas daejeonensis]|uniref:Nitrate ABC transporter substrate-binding protein n=1 Tax=Pseudoxanthomonas daejeonensis TaxID=266062 RepID=A0ABQ6Z3J5_9GAMM|nr:CmpA/NrtA family ABC transporter substrate-binding protein [Pseudoxanthomonas daejeonensis]KAF1692062.1 nitrate ABC transporter substrate-binding protein [Pseudoxanthomonas daejeonensis]
MTNAGRNDPHALDVGFMPLLDAAPLLVAARLGLDRQHGVALRLHRQASWAALRGRLLSSELDAAHAMEAMVLGVQTGIGGPRADLAILLGLNRNGQAITVSPALATALDQGRTVRDALRALPRRAVFAQTFPTGTHALWLYDWLARQGVDPTCDIEVLTLPPPQMPQALAEGELDGFCAGEPWGEQAEATGAGRRVVRSGQAWPGHPEKVLACRRDFAALQPELALALTTMALEACRWLDADPSNRMQAAQWLSAPEAIGLPVARLAEGLLPRDGDVPGEALQFHAQGEANVPRAGNGRWFLQQFRRWRWLPPATEDDARDAWLADVYRIDTYRQAAGQLGVAVPAGDTAPGLRTDATD